MLDVPVAPERISRIYTAAAAFYDNLVDQYEAKAKARALALLAPRRGERYLEVAVGTGVALASLLARDAGVEAVGVDLSAGMLDVARRRFGRRRRWRPRLLLADARRLPFPDATFDCLFNSYMLDLIPTEELPKVLSEYGRVLRPGGRLALVNLTEGEGEDVAFSEEWKRRYQEDPERLCGCRPVRVEGLLAGAGFSDARREYMGHGESWPSEIVTARRRP